MEKAFKLKADAIENYEINTMWMKKTKDKMCPCVPLIVCFVFVLCCSCFVLVLVFLLFALLVALFIISWCFPWARCIGLRFGAGLRWELH
jgi:hypothetical protein